MRLDKEVREDEADDGKDEVDEVIDEGEAMWPKDPEEDEESDGGGDWSMEEWRLFSGSSGRLQTCPRFGILHLLHL